MHSLNHVFGHAKKFGFRNTPLYTVSLMIFFWSIFDGILTYILPLKITEQGFSKTEMGVIIGTSSIAGAIFDLFLSKFVKKPSFRRLYLAMFLLSFVFMIFLYGANILSTYILAMAVWGFYWDLHNFGNSNFVCKTASATERASSFGVMNIFRALGCLSAPLIAGLVVGGVVTALPFILSGVVLGIAFLFYLVLMAQQPHQKAYESPHHRHTPKGFIEEFLIWRKIGKQLRPVLLLTLLIFISDAFFWTIGPLVAEDPDLFGELSGLFFVAYLLPPLLFGWFVGPISSRFGKKRTALFSFLIGMLIISTLSFVGHPILMLVVIFLAASFISLALPSINGAYADYISETEPLGKEIHTLSDFFYNAGWVMGPILAGLSADTFGNKQSFTILGIACACITLFLIAITPRKIKLKVAQI